MKTFVQTKNMMMDELNQIFDVINEEQVYNMVNLICDTKKVFVVGVGRVLLMLQAFEKRLNHLGIESYFVGEINEPAITKEDVLVVGSGSGESIFPLSVIKLAKKYGAITIHIGSNPNSSMKKYEDLFVRIPCQTKLYLPDEIQSNQLMSSLFEQSLLLLCDVVASMIAEQRNIKDIQDLWRNHANLE